MFMWLTAGFISSLTLILIFALTNHLSAPSLIAASLFNAVVNLAYGFAASYIFYVINIYLPNKKATVKTAHQAAELLKEIREHSLEVANTLKNFEDRNINFQFAKVSLFHERNHRILSEIKNLIPPSDIRTKIQKSISFYTCPYEFSVLDQKETPKIFFATAEVIDQLMLQISSTPQQYCNPSLAHLISTTYLSLIDPLDTLQDNTRETNSIQLSKTA